MNVTYDEQHDRIYLRVGDGRQTRDGGYTQPVYVSPDEDDPSREPGVMVQLGFEQPCRLRFISVEPASLTFHEEFLAEVRRRARGSGTEGA